MPNKKLTYEFVKSEFEKEGYKLLSKEYINSRSKLDYICPNRHEHSTSYGNFKFGYRCPYCCGKNKKTISFIKSEFEKEGYILLTDEYKNNNQKLDYICPEGHKHQISWNKWQYGRRCFYCYGNIRKSINFIKSDFENAGYNLLTTYYKNAKQSLVFICPNGHKHKVTWDNWKSKGHRCSKCKVSIFEKEIKYFVGFLGVDFLGNDRQILKNPDTNRFLELDIWIPDLNAAIECNGVYWHSSVGRKKRDKIKKYLCKQQNINLLIITDKDWYNNKNKTKEKIINFLGV